MITHLRKVGKEGDDWEVAQGGAVQMYYQLLGLER